MQMPSEEDLNKLVVGSAINIVLDVDEMVRTVLKTCYKYGVNPEYWAEVVTNSEVRSLCENVRKIPPFDLYDENGEFLDGKFWSMEDAIVQANWLNSESQYEFIQIQNFAGNTCETIENNGEEDGDDN